MEVRVWLGHAGGLENAQITSPSLLPLAWVLDLDFDRRGLALDGDPGVRRRRLAGVNEYLLWHAILQLKALALGGDEPLAEGAGQPELVLDAPRGGVVEARGSGSCAMRPTDIRSASVATTCPAVGIKPLGSLQVPLELPILAVDSLSDVDLGLAGLLVGEGRAPLRVRRFLAAEDV